MMARPELLNAILQMESGGNPKARSRKGARGLMQLMPGTAIEMGIMPDMIDDPGSNVMGGVGYFNKMLKRYKGDEWKALIAYNAGPGAMDTWTIPPESLKYAANVLRRAPRQQKPLINRALGAAGSALSGLMGEGTAEAMWPFSSPPPKSEVPLMPSRSFDPGYPRYDPSVMPRPFPPGPGVAASKGPGSTLEIPSLPRPNPATTPTRPANVAPAVDSGGTPQIKGLPAGWSVGNTPAAPTQPSQPGEIRGLPPGWKISAGSSSGRITIGDPTTTAERSREQKMSVQGQKLHDQLIALRTIYDSKIKPKLDSGQIGSSTQAEAYIDTGRARQLGYTLDPDVAEYITLSGPIAQSANAYYSAQSGGKGGITLLKEGTNPHVPHPPTGTWNDVMRGQWDLQKQRENIETMLKVIELNENQRTPESFGGPPTRRLPPDAVPMSRPKNKLPPDAVPVLR